MLRSRFLLSGLGSAVVIGLVACGEPTAPGVDESAPAFNVASSRAGESEAPIVCPTRWTRSASAIIGPEGGTVELDGHRVTLPSGAVDQPTEITLRTPRSKYLVVNLRANGEEIVEFPVPVTVTISYARCHRGDLNRRDLSAWELDPATESLLGSMSSTHDAASRSVTFTTTHFSHFVIAD